MPGSSKSIKKHAALALALLIPIPTVGTVAALWVWPGAVGQGIYFASKVLLAVFPVAWHVLADRQRISWSKPTRGGFVTGVVSGLLIAAVIVASYEWLAHRWIDAEVFRDKAAQNGLDSPSRYIAFAGFILLLNALMEEYVWRWFVFRKCEALLSGARHVGAAAVILAAAFFTIHHVFALKAQFGWTVTVIGSLGCFVGGAWWSWMMLRFGSIWPGYVSHALVNIGMFIVGWRVLFG